MNMKDKKKRMKDREIEKVKLEQVIDLRELELIISLKGG